MTKKKEQASYEDAMKELQTIVNGLQEETISVDKLGEKVKRASELISFCRTKLRNTETEVKGAFE